MRSVTADPTASLMWAVRCVRCRRSIALPAVVNGHADLAMFEGCPVCHSHGAPSNLSVEPDLSVLRHHVGPGGKLPVGDGAGIWRYRAFLPVASDRGVTLGEGNTPLIKLERCGRRLGLERLYVKDESRQPTWSYKDRAVAVTKAVEGGARTVTAYSTGNHGASTAAYAARAGLRSVIFTLASVPDVMKTLMQAYGACVVALPSARTPWSVLASAVRDWGWYPTSGYIFPPIGSNPFGIEGYKTIAFEIWEQLGAVPDWVAVPTCFGDGMIGIWKGWRELRELAVVDGVPRMVAAEIFGSVAAALERGEDRLHEVDTFPTPAFSIATPIGTSQTIVGVRQSGGVACAVGREDLVTLQRLLAAEEGIYAEAASLVSLAALVRLRREGRISAASTVVGVLTSSGLKDPGVTAARLPTVPVVPAVPDDIARALKSTYGMDV